MNVYLNTIKTVNGLDIKERYGKEFRRIRRIQPRDSVSYRFVVYHADTALDEFRRFKSAEKFCQRSQVISTQ